MKKKFIPLLFIALFILFLLSGCTDQQTQTTPTFYVNAQGGSDYQTLHQAIQNASDGHTIIVYRGTYTEELIINKTLTIQAADTTHTIIQPKQTNQKSIFSLEADNITITGFTIQATPATIGIDISCSNTTISHNSFQNTKTAVNIKKNSYHTTIHNNTFLNNEQAVYADYSYHTTITYNTLTLDDTASYLLSYGIFLQNSKHTILSYNTITNYYRGMRIKGTQYTSVYNNNLYENKIGIWCCCGAVQTTIYNNNFIQNELHAQDDVYNQWDNGGIGNYWDDYLTQNPEGLPTNGIYDTPYIIYYWRNQEPLNPKQDRYPLVNPVV